MSLPKRLRTYRSYLLSFWQEADARREPDTAWRFTLQDPHSGERLGFATMEKLIAHLTKQMNATDSQVIEPNASEQNVTGHAQNDATENSTRE